MAVEKLVSPRPHFLYLYYLYLFLYSCTQLREILGGVPPVTRASAVPAAALAWGSSVEYRQQRKSKKAAPQGAVPPRYGAASSALRQKYGDRPLLSFIWTACNRFFSLSPGRSSYLCRKAKFRKEVLTWIRTSIITASSFCCASFGKAAASAKRSCGG